MTAQFSDTDGDDWEYEYHARESEEFYFTLDLPTGSAFGDRKRKSDDSTAQLNNAKRKTGATTVPGRMQILGLHEDRPIISFRGKVYECHWSEIPGTELIVSGKDLSNQPRNQSAHTDPDCKILAATSTKLEGRPIRLKRKLESAEAQDATTQRRSPRRSSPTSVPPRDSLRPSQSQEPVPAEDASSPTPDPPSTSKTPGVPAAVIPSVISFHTRLAEIRARQGTTSTNNPAPRNEASPAKSIQSRDRGRGRAGRPRRSIPSSALGPVHPPLAPRPSATSTPQHVQQQTQPGAQLPYQWPRITSTPASNTRQPSQSSSMPPSASTPGSRAPRCANPTPPAQTQPQTHWMQRQTQQTSADELRRFMDLASDTARGFRLQQRGDQNEMSEGTSVGPGPNRSQSSVLRIDRSQAAQSQAAQSQAAQSQAAQSQAAQSQAGQSHVSGMAPDQIHSAQETGAAVMEGRQMSQQMSQQPGSQGEAE